jgi:hypothetical protein
MADTKISALTAATVPLAGTEVLPIVQSGTTKKVPVSDLTAGRAVSGLSFATGTAAATLTMSGTSLATSGTDANIAVNISSKGTSPVQINSTQGLLSSAMVGDAVGFRVNDTTNSKNIQFFRAGSGYNYLGIVGVQSAIYSIDQFTIAVDSNGTFNVSTGGAIRHTMDSVGDTTLHTGNLKFGTSGKGIDFSATPGTGTSELLSDYEEGTWTPGQGGGLVVVGTFSSSGKYTKIGRTVFIQGRLEATTSVSFAGGAADITNGLPFTVSGEFPLLCYNGNYTATATALASGTTVYSVTSMASTSAVVFSGFYFV